MKTSIASAVFFLGALLITNAANAQSHSVVETENFKARFTHLQGSTKVQVAIAKPMGEKLWITVKDARQYPICYLDMERRETEHLFSIDMKEMPDGKYTFDLEAGKKAKNGKRPIVSKTLVKEKALLAQPIVGERFVFTN
jgi:hypothetical protein